MYIYIYIYIFVCVCASLCVRLCVCVRWFMNQFTFLKDKKNAPALSECLLQNLEQHEELASSSTEVKQISFTSL